MDNEKLKNIIKENFSIISIVAITIMILFAINTNVALFSGKDQNTVDEQDKLNESSLNETSSNETLSTEDEKTLDFIYLSYSVILYDLDCISKAAKNRNFTDTERCAKFLKENSNRTISQIDSYNNSTFYEELELYKKYLEYYNIAGANLEIGARNRSKRQMNNASIYIQKANRGMTGLMGPLNETAPTYSNNNSAKNVTWI